MSKIICDVCGTSYPDTATQCPICGCVRPSDVSAVPGEPVGTEAEQSGTYTHVKGGRFSKANVRKRNEGQHIDEEQQLDEYEAIAPPQRKKAKNNDIGLVVAICVLLLSIVAVVIYISTQFFGKLSTQEPAYSVTETTEAETTEDTIPVETDIPCESVLVSKTSVTLTAVGETCQLSATCNPADTTDELVYSTADDLIATVTADGVITAVSAGETEILVTCGSVYAVCRVVCDIPQDETVENTVAAEENEGTQTVVLELNRTDFTIPVKGKWKLYNGDIPVDQIIWTSDNESVAKIKDGVVTGVRKGSTMVHAEYNGVKVDCKVFVK